ncbi:hypothetical protein C5C31_11745 [Rathayibacter rathayi]|uniref:Ribbon-helix-helix protein CopG domain-containing protein n=1 Tax=Rathayibacter rathayi TaxID=33887 RepID=A0ABD6W8S3_RATRA|nr:hypothetical protein [Rathayibacter rathayi]AZZ49785.1 hypothetical protein C1O28_11820 [Rathayibacter rathayi]PPF14346.1 hypothetical protein C5C04_07030 [Rathayibacter rathayi]PPF22215.1 hypothetical protein C5C34_12060 [Rathayibacter rathayi]PPF46711.1 hypothetical protein C5C08_11215 [Rathayibacter rathayi]PPF78575.1 hypothetical protein C5C14_11025 [Rathayibacter rathayi]
MHGHRHGDVLLRHVDEECGDLAGDGAPRRAQPAPDRSDPIASKPRPAPAPAAAPAPTAALRTAATAPRPRKQPTEVLHADIDAELSYYVEDLRAATGRTKRNIVEAALSEYRNRNPLA